MRFLVDMGLSRHTSNHLNRSGHDSIHLRDLGQQRSSDQEIIEQARNESRIILTHDLDFGRIVALSRGHLPSVITFRLQDMSPQNVNQRVELVIRRFETQLVAGALISVTEEDIRVRLLPVE
jgi:predicted nuclease of predicted toxin-antitoxin system